MKISRKAVTIGYALTPLPPLKQNPIQKKKELVMA
jgi:hypothetical protein